MADEWVDFFDEDLVHDGFVIDVIDFTRLGVKISSVLYRSHAVWLRVAQDCRVHFGDRSVVSKLIEEIVEKLFLRWRSSRVYGCNHWCNVGGCWNTLFRVDANVNITKKEWYLHSGSFLYTIFVTHKLEGGEKTDDLDEVTWVVELRFH